MRRRIAIELAVVCALLVVAGYIWFYPASRELVAGNASTMVGDASDSITNVWQYQLVVDTFHGQPWHLAYGALYTDQANAPDGLAVFIPYSERVIVLLLNVFMRVDLMPTAVVWVYVVGSGLAMHVCARLLGWSRTLAFALALAWAICPHTRARAECHIALVGVYFAPAAVAGIRILAGAPPALNWSRRTEVAVAAVLLLAAAAAAHYYAILLVGFAPAFVVLYVLFLPPGTAWRAATARLAIAALPALALVISTGVAPLPRDEARIVATNPVAPERLREANELSLKLYGAHALDYFGGDVRFGDRDLNPIRSAITRDIRASVSANYHERTNGIRWTVLLAFGVLGAAVVSKRGRHHVPADDRRLATFLVVFCATALLVSVGPTGIRHHDTDLGPALVLARLVPAFRVANRAGVLVHFGALLATGIVVTAIVARVAPSWRARIPALLLGLVVVEYLPLHPVQLAPVAVRRDALVPPSGECGAGVTVPYVTYASQADQYYAAFTELRHTSCALLHAKYLAPEDDRLIKALSSRAFTDEDLERALTFARCTGASWAIFRLGAPERFQRAFCDALGWSFVAPDACRGASASPVRSVRECAP